jgi:sugar lactone lactonase YvrE
MMEEIPRQQDMTSYDFSFRGIIAESWNLIEGIKGEIIGAGLIAAVLSTALIFIGYGLSRLIGEPGRNLYAIYALQYGFSAFGYPLFAGLIMMGAKRAIGTQITVSMVFRFFNARIIILSLILTLVEYMLFALLLSLGIDHFYASASGILFTPIFVLTVPLIAESGLTPFTAISRFFIMFRRHFLLMSGLYLALACINFFGSFVVIGSVWTIPIFVVSNGVMFRNLINEEKNMREANSVIDRRLHTSFSRAVKIQPALEGNKWQNVIAVILVLLIILSAGFRLWALNASSNIYPPDHVASNGRNICVHSNKVLYFLSPEGQTQKSVQLSASGLKREPADLELLNDGSLLIGDLDKKSILRCSLENLSCCKIGPPNNYQINEYFKFCADEKRGMLFIADTNNHRVLVQDMEGTYYKIIESSTKIDYPNDITMDEQGMLWLTNTLHERLLGFHVNGNSITESGKVINLNPLESGITAIGEALLKTKDKKQTLEDLKAAKRDLDDLKRDLPSAMIDMLHTRPAALAWGADGNVWVAAGDPVKTTAGIRVFDPDGKQVRSIHLDQGAIPDDIVRVGNLMLIADIGLFQVFAARADSGNIFPFGDETFQQALADSRTKIEFYESIGKWTKRLLWVLAISTVTLLFIILKSRHASARKRAA